MSYELFSDQQEGGRRVKTFRNKHGSETKITPIHTDKGGRTWWGFVDLLKIPYIRMAHAQNITNLFSLGLTLKDMNKWCEDEKALLRSNDPEKYEKLYALVLEKEKAAKQLLDPVRQHLSLCSVYVLDEDERVDYFDDVQAEKKLKEWSLFPETVAFFLNWHLGHTRNFLEPFQNFSQMFSKQANPKPPKQSRKRKK